MAYTTIDDPSAYFQAHAYTGDNSGSGQTITFGGNSDLQPDLTWLKVRNSAGGNHYLANSSMGENNSVHIRLVPNGTQTENDGYTDNFASDGFRTIDNNITTNGSYNYISWNWKGNGGTRTTNSESGDNPAGGYQVNTTAGFSIVDYTGTGATGTMAHGLGAVPEMIIIKNRDAADAWAVYHHKSTGAPNTDYLVLNTTAASADDATYWNDTSPTSTVFTVNTAHNVNADAETYIAFCWTAIKGYSKFGSWLGNGDADGPFVYTGFKPAFLMAKGYLGTDDWIMLDNKRSGYNSENEYIDANQANVESDGTGVIDFLSNGFKMRSSFSSLNYDSGGYIYAAFAESPLVTSGGVPATAR